MSDCKTIVFRENINNPGVGRMLDEEVHSWFNDNRSNIKDMHGIFGVELVSARPIVYRKTLTFHYHENVNENTELIITSTSVSNMIIDKEFTQNLRSNISGTSWSIIGGSLPPGITLSENGILSGRATATGIYTFTVECKWGEKIATKEYSVNIAKRLITIIFETDGGTCSETRRELAEGSMIGTLPEVTKDGYEFGGWFTAPTGGLKVDQNYSVASNTTLYARWGQGSDIEFGDATTQFNIQVNGDRTNYANQPYTFYHRYSDGSTSDLTIQTAISSSDGTNNMIASNKVVTLYMKVTNNGSAGNFDIGFDCDSYVSGNDKVIVKRISKGVSLGGFTVTVPYDTSIWVGKYNERVANRYKNVSTNTSTTSDVDSGYAFTMNNIFINSSSYTILEVTFKLN